MTGIVTSWKQTDEGKPGTYGWVTPDEDKSGNIFIHFSDIQSDGFRYLSEGDVVEFDVAETERGKKAVNVRLVD